MDEELEAQIAALPTTEDDEDELLAPAPTEGPAPEEIDDPLALPASGSAPSDFTPLEDPAPDEIAPAEGQSEFAADDIDFSGLGEQVPTAGTGTIDDDGEDDLIAPAQQGATPRARASGIPGIVVDGAGAPGAQSTPRARVSGVPGIADAFESDELAPAKRDSSLEGIVSRNPGLSAALEKGDAPGKRQALEAANLISRIHDRGLYDLYQRGTPKQRNDIVNGVIQEAASEIASKIPNGKGRGAVFKNTQKSLGLTAMTLDQLPEFQRGGASTVRQEVAGDGGRRSLQDQFINALKREDAYDKFTKGDNAARQKIVGPVLNKLAREQATRGGKFDRDAYYRAVDDYKLALVTLDKHPEFAPKEEANKPVEPRRTVWGLAWDSAVSAAGGAAALAPGLASTTLSVIDKGMEASGLGGDAEPRQFVQGLRSWSNGALTVIDDTKKAAYTDYQNKLNADLSKAISEGGLPALQFVASKPQVAIPIIAEMLGGAGVAGAAIKGAAKVTGAQWTVSQIALAAGTAQSASQGGSSGKDQADAYLQLKPEAQQAFQLYKDVRTRLVAGGTRAPSHEQIRNEVAQTINSTSSSLAAGISLLTMGFGAEAQLARLLAGSGGAAATGTLAQRAATVGGRVATGAAGEAVQEAGEQFGALLGTELARSGATGAAVVAAASDPSVRGAAAVGGVLGGALGGVPRRGGGTAEQGPTQGDTAEQELLALPPPPDFVADAEGRVGTDPNDVIEAGFEDTRERFAPVDAEPEVEPERELLALPPPPDFVADSSGGVGRNQTEAMQAGIETARARFAPESIESTPAASSEAAAPPVGDGLGSPGPATEDAAPAAAPTVDFADIDDIASASREAGPRAAAVDNFIDQADPPLLRGMLRAATQATLEPNATEDAVADLETRVDREMDAIGESAERLRSRLREELGKTKATKEAQLVVPRGPRDEAPRRRRPVEDSELAPAPASPASTPASAPTVSDPVSDLLKRASSTKTDVEFRQVIQGAPKSVLDDLARRVMARTPYGVERRDELGRLAVGVQNARGREVAPAVQRFLNLHRELTGSVHPVVTEVGKAIDAVEASQPPAVKAAVRRMREAGAGATPDEQLDAAEAKPGAAINQARTSARTDRIVDGIKKVIPEINRDLDAAQTLAALGELEQKLGARIRAWQGDPDAQALWDSFFRPQNNVTSVGGRNMWAIRKGKADAIAKALEAPGLAQDMVQTKARYNQVLAKLVALNDEIGSGDASTLDTSFRRAQRAAARGQRPVDFGTLRSWAAREEAKHSHLGLTVIAIENDAVLDANPKLAARLAGQRGFSGAFVRGSQTRNPIIILNADYIADLGEAEVSLRHELYGHYGPETMLGQAYFGQLLGHLERLSVESPEVRAIVRGVEQDYPLGNGTTRATQLAEVIARMAEGQRVPNYEPSVAERIGDIKRRFLSAIGFDRTKRMTFEQLDRSIREMRSAMDTGTPREGYLAQVAAEFKTDFGQAADYATAPEQYKVSRAMEWSQYLFDETKIAQNIVSAEARTSGDPAFQAQAEEFKLYLRQVTAIRNDLDGTRQEIVKRVETELRNIAESRGMPVNYVRDRIGQQSLALMTKHFHDQQFALSVPLTVDAVKKRQALMNEIYTNPGKSPDQIWRELYTLANDPANQADPKRAAAVRAGMDNIGITDTDAAQIEKDLRQEGLWDPLLALQDGELAALRKQMLEWDYESGRHNERYIQFRNMPYYMPRKGLVRDESYTLGIEDFNPFNESRSATRGRQDLRYEDRAPRNLLEGLYEESRRSVRDRAAEGLKDQFIRLAPYLPRAIRVTSVEMTLPDGTPVNHPVFEGGDNPGFRFGDSPKNLDVGRFKRTQRDGAMVSIELVDKNFVDTWAAHRDDETPITGVRREIGRGTRTLSRVFTQRNPGFLGLAFTRDVLQDSLISTMEAAGVGTPKLQTLRNFWGQVAELSNPFSRTQLQRDTWDYFHADHDTRARLVKDIRANPERAAASAPLLRYLDARIPRDFTRQFGASDEILNIQRELQAPTQGLPGKAWEAYTSRIDPFGTYLDNVHRIALHETLLKGGVDPTRAATITIDAANFNQRSKFGQQFGWAYMFAQTAATGVDRLVNRAIWNGLEPPLRTRQVVDERGRNTVEVYLDPAEAWTALNKPLLATLVGAGATAVIIGALTMGTDDEGSFNARKIAPETWFRDILIGDGTAVPFRIGLPYGEAQVFGAIGTAAALLAFGFASADDVMRGWTNAILGNTLPAGRVQIPDAGRNPLHAALLGMTPSLLQPIAQYATNMNPFGGPIDARDNPRSKDKYASDTGFNSTPPAYKDVATAVREATGNAMDFTPESYRFLLNSLGIVGAPLRALADATGVDQSEKPWWDTVNKAVGNVVRLDNSASSFEARQQAEFLRAYVSPALKELNRAVQLDRDTGASEKRDNGRWTVGPRQEALRNEQPWIAEVQKLQRQLVQETSRAANQATVALSKGEANKAWQINQELKATRRSYISKMQKAMGR